MPKTYKHPDVEERDILAVLKSQGHSLREINTILNRYGSAVTLAVQDKDLLCAESKGIRSRLAAALKNHGITVWTGAEMAGVGVLAHQMEATLEDLARAAFPYPTRNESLADAARECFGRSIFLP